MRLRTFTIGLLTVGLLIATMGCRQVAKLVLAKGASERSAAGEIAETLAVEGVERALRPEIDGVTKNFDFLAADTPYERIPVEPPSFTIESTVSVLAVPMIDPPEPESYTLQTEMLIVQQQADARLVQALRQQQLQQVYRPHYPTPATQLWTPYR